MDFNEKVTAASEILEAKGFRRRVYAPSFVAFLWRLGLKVPPPHYAGFLGTFAFAGVLFGAVWGTIMWFAVWSRHGVAPSSAAAYAAVFGAVAGLAVASYYRVSARRHAIPR